MKAKFGREIGLLMLPVLFIGGVAMWKSRDGAPEDLWKGKARIVTQVREVEVTPFDVYRGYTHRIAIDGWTAGDLPRVPPRRAGATKTSRVVAARMPPLAVAFRQGRKWKTTVPREGWGDWKGKMPPRQSQVAPEIASLDWHDSDGESEIRKKFTQFFVLRLPEVPRVEEAVLRGRTKVDLEDRDVRMIGGVPTGDIVKSHSLFSDELRVPLRLGKDAPKQEMARVPEWEVESVIVSGFGSATGSQPSAMLVLRRVANGLGPSHARMMKPRLLDAKGRVVKTMSYWNIGMDAPTKGKVRIGANYSVLPSQWKKWAKPLTFQGIVSVNDSWPVEVNVELGRQNAVLPPKNSKLPFIREPLPLR